LRKYQIIVKKAPLKKSQKPVERGMKNNRMSLKITGSPFNKIRNEKDPAEAVIV